MLQYTSSDFEHFGVLWRANLDSWLLCVGRPAEDSSGTFSVDSSVALCWSLAVVRVLPHLYFLALCHSEHQALL